MLRKKTQNTLFDAPHKESEKGGPPAEEARLTGEKIFRVGEFLDFLNGLWKGNEYVVQGEISEFKSHPSGVYFALKDGEEEGVLYCYMNPYAYRMLGVTLEDGFVVRAYGAPNIYKPKGRMSFVLRTMTLAGEGSLKKAYEALKKKLEEEGLFARKRPIPEFIGRIGVITSKTGAVIDDFRKNLKPLGFHLSLFDTRVEGPSAPANIIRGVKWFNERDPECDVIVLIRGGGSLEDLQPFNNEYVARAVFGSHIPVIAGIGHDRDVPIVSLVADAQTSTPSFAAAMANASWDRVLLGVPRIERELVVAFHGALTGFRFRLSRYGERCMARIARITTRYTTLEVSLLRTFALRLSAIDSFLAHAAHYLSAVDPERNLKLGYGIVFDKYGNVIKNARDVAKGDIIRTRLYQGGLSAEVREVEKDEH